MCMTDALEARPTPSISAGLSEPIHNASCSGDMHWSLKHALDFAPAGMNGSIGAKAASPGTPSISGSPPAQGQQSPQDALPPLEVGYMGCTESENLPKCRLALDTISININCPMSQN